MPSATSSPAPGTSRSTSCSSAPPSNSDSPGPGHLTPGVSWSLWQVQVQPRGHVVGGRDGAAEHSVDIGGDVGWIGTTGAVLSREAQDGGRLAFVPSASSARDILPAVMCSVIVAPALAAPGMTGMPAITATWMAGNAPPVSGSLSYWRKAHSATTGIGY